MISICQQCADAAHRLRNLNSNQNKSATPFARSSTPINSRRNNPSIPAEGTYNSSVNFPKTLLMTAGFKRPDNNSYRRVKGIFIIVVLCLAHFITTTLSSLQESQIQGCNDLVEFAELTSRSRLSLSKSPYPAKTLSRSFFAVAILFRSLVHTQYRACRSSKLL